MNHMQTVVFDPYKGTLLVNVSIPPEIVDHVRDYAEKRNLLLKKDFHFTLISFALAKTLREIHETLFPHIEKLAKSFDWNFDLRNKYYLLKKHFLYHSHPSEDRESIIVVIYPHHLEAFWKSMNEMFGENLPIPFPHITLATKSSDPANQETGIGIKTFADFDLIEKEDITEKLT